MIRQDILITLETLLKSNAEFFGDHEAGSDDTQHGMMMKYVPAASFKMTNAYLGTSHAVVDCAVFELSCRHGRRQRRTATAEHLELMKETDSLLPHIEAVSLDLIRIVAATTTDGCLPLISGSSRRLYLLGRYCRNYRNTFRHRG